MTLEQVGLAELWAGGCQPGWARWKCNYHSWPVSQWASKGSAAIPAQLRGFRDRWSHEWEHSYRSFIYGDIKYATIIPQHQSNKQHCSIWSGISKNASHIHRERQNAELFMLWLWTNIEKISEFGTMQQSRFRADYCTSFNQNRLSHYPKQLFLLQKKWVKEV